MNGVLAHSSCSRHGGDGRRRACVRGVRRVGDAHVERVGGAERMWGAFVHVDGAHKAERASGSHGATGAGSMPECAACVRRPGAMSRRGALAPAACAWSRQARPPVAHAPPGASTRCVQGRVVRAVFRSLWPYMSARADPTLSLHLGEPSRRRHDFGRFLACLDIESGPDQPNIGPTR